jgi:hypothetical protein
MVEKTEDWEISSRAPEMVKVQRLGESRRAKWPEVPGPSAEGEDIVCSAVKVAAARRAVRGTHPGEQPERNKQDFQGLMFPISHVSSIMVTLKQS